MTENHNLIQKANLLSELNLELLDVLTTTLAWVREYCHKHNIPLRNEDSLYRLILYLRKLIKEINMIEESEHLTFDHDDFSPTDKFTERLFAKFLRDERKMWTPRIVAT